MSKHSLLGNSFVSRFELHGHFLTLGGAQLNNWSDLVVLRIGKLKVKEVEPQGDHQLECHLSESFAKTDANATQEGREGERASLAAIRSLVPFTFRVETVWLEKFGVFPLLRVITGHLKADIEWLAFLHIDSANTKILGETGCR